MRVRRILVVDTYYPEFLATRSAIPADASYEDELADLLQEGFGTFDGYSHALENIGWHTQDVIANYAPLQRLWARRHGYPPAAADTMSLGEILDAQVSYFQPDVIFLQDISSTDPGRIARWRSSGYFIAGQCSCALGPAETIRLVDVIFTSLPTHVGKFQQMGVRAEYLPLAFDPRMTPEVVDRDFDITFVGGVGSQSHWRAGTAIMEMLAERFTYRFHWYGYGIDNLDAKSILRACYWGPAWGRKLYEIYGRSKIVVNRHGEVSQGFANNLRLYEATGSGALLMTEAAPNLRTLFPEGTAAVYVSGDDLYAALVSFLRHDRTRNAVAAAGKEMTLAHHNYEVRMASVSNVLVGCLNERKVQAAR